MKQMMKQLNTPVTSSKFFLSVCFCRKYSIDTSSVQLSEDMEFIYNDLTRNFNYSNSVSRTEFDNIQQRVVSGLYVLSPIDVLYLSRKNVEEYRDLLALFYPDFMVLPTMDPFLYIVILPNKKDVLVYLGLSIMLYRLSHGCLPKKGYRMSNLIYPFYDNISNMGKVDRLYNITLNPSLSILKKSTILDKVKPFVCEGSVCYNLISSFLDLPMIDTYGNSISRQGCLITVGDINLVLFDIVLMDFDREFAKRFPGIAISRYFDLVYISTRENDKVIFDEKAFNELLDELGLLADITSIGPGDEPIICSTKKIYISNDSSKLVVCDI